MKRVTIKDLSRHLLLSKSTVSRALNDDKNIRKETREKVLAAAKELGYQPNPSALNLKMGKSNSIGVIVPEMVTPFSARVIQGIESIFAESRFRIMVAQCNEDPEIEEKNLLMMEDFRVDGIIMNLCHDTHNHQLYRSIIERGTPIVFFDRIPPSQLDVSKVLVDDQNRAAMMVEHLINTGKKRIVHIMGPNSIRNAILRAAGYRDVLTHLDLLDERLIIQTTGTSFNDGKEAIESLLVREIEFDAVFAFTDSLAIGAMNYLLERQYRIPDDVAIASFSGTELSQMVYPPLTTVEQPLEEMGKEAATLLLDKIRKKSTASKTVVLQPELVFRKSTVSSEKH